MICLELPASRGVGKDHQKSAEAIAVARQRNEWPNLSGGDSHACSLSGPGRSLVETREPTMQPAGPEVPRAIGVPIGCQATRRTKPNSLPQIRFCPVDRNRPFGTARPAVWEDGGGDPAS